MADLRVRLLDLATRIATEFKTVRTEIANGLSGKQATLVSGTNIKTIGGSSILGAGDISVGDTTAVKYVSQSLTEAQKTIARQNINAASNLDKYIVVDYCYDGGAAVTNAVLNAAETAQGVTGLGYTSYILVVQQGDPTKNGIYRRDDGLLVAHSNNINDFVHEDPTAKLVNIAPNKLVYIKNGTYSGYVAMPQIVSYGDNILPNSTCSTGWIYDEVQDAYITNNALEVAAIRQIGFLIPSTIIQDSTNRFVTDTEKSTWNSKANASHTHTAAQITDFNTAAIAAVSAGAPALLDTIDELAAALGDDPNFATSTATALANRVRYDAAQTLSAGQKTQACTNIGIGEPDTDFVSTFNTGLL